MALGFLFLMQQFLGTIVSFLWLYLTEKCMKTTLYSSLMGGNSQPAWLQMLDLGCAPT